MTDAIRKAVALCSPLIGLGAAAAASCGACGWDGEGASLHRWSSGLVTVLLAPSSRLLE